MRHFSWTLIFPSFSSVCPSFLPGLVGDLGIGLGGIVNLSEASRENKVQDGRQEATPKRNKNGIFPSSHHLFRSHNSTHSSKMVSALRASLKKVLYFSVIYAYCIC